MRVLLISPYITTKHDTQVLPTEPLGLLYIATYANQEIQKKTLNISVRILDANLGTEDACIKTERGFRSGMSDQAIEAELLDYKPDIVGVTNNFTTHLEDVLEICCLVKRICPGSLVSIGGAHATIAHKDLVVRPEVDIVVRREGEETFWILLTRYYDGDGLENVQGITYKDQDGFIHVNDERPIIQDIDSLPIPDRSLIQYEKYFSSSVFNIVTRQKPIGTIFSSRGCPFNCIFCSTHKVWTNRWRGRSPENVLEEIEYLRDTYGIKEIFFEDDQFVGSKQRIIDLCNLIIEKDMGMNFYLPPGLSPALVDEYVIDRMRKAGFYRITFSIDIGNEDINAYVKKPIKLEKVRNLIKKTNAMGMWTNATFIIGYPHETEEDIQKTIDFAYSMKLDYIMFYIAQPYLGSKLYDIFVEKGLIDETHGKIHQSVVDSVCGTDMISAERLMEIRDKAERQYFRVYLLGLLNPKYLFTEFMPKILSPIKLWYFFRLNKQVMISFLPWIMSNWIKKRKIATKDNVTAK
ncbi:MAG: radical SAM protein [Pseudomonadota bacterium]